MWKIVIQEEHLYFESSLRFYSSYGIIVKPLISYCAALWWSSRNFHQRSLDGATDPWLHRRTREGASSHKPRRTSSRTKLQQKVANGRGTDIASNPARRGGRGVSCWKDAIRILHWLMEGKWHWAALSSYTLNTTVVRLTARASADAVQTHKGYHLKFPPTISN